jgi:hypothetical protein
MNRRSPSSRIRNAHYRRIRAAEELDVDADGAPDVFQSGDPRP